MIFKLFKFAASEFGPWLGDLVACLCIFLLLGLGLLTVAVLT